MWKLLIFLSGMGMLAVTSGKSPLRWCVVYGREIATCKETLGNIQEKGLLVCIIKSNKKECMELISRNEADMAWFSTTDVYTAGKYYNLMPILGEQVNEEPGLRYYGVAIAKATSDISFTNLRGRKTCHTGVRRTVGWNLPIGYLLYTGQMERIEGDELKSAANFFGGSCAGGALESQSVTSMNGSLTNLCKLCKSPTDIKASADIKARCSRSYEKNGYYGYEGAFKCMDEDAGEVAFVKHYTIKDKILDDPSKDNSKYVLLCADGSRAPVEDYTICNIGRVPGSVAMTSEHRGAKEILEMKSQLLKWFKEGRYETAAKGYDNPEIFDVKDKNTYLKWLGKGSNNENWLKSVKGLESPMQKDIRWCTISKLEMNKCKIISALFTRNSIKPALRCVLPDSPYSAERCMKLITMERADMISLDGGDIYTAGRKYDLVPILGEDYDSTIQGSSYYAVAVIKNRTRLNIFNLKGTRSCHTGLNKTSGWFVPIGFLLQSGLMKWKHCNMEESAEEFFSSSCVPGAKPQSRLCSICKSKKCLRNSAEPYYGYEGAFKCLQEGAGDVAFVKHSTLISKPNKDEYSLLCKDGSTAPPCTYKQCNLARVPSHAVVTRPGYGPEIRVLKDVWLKAQQTLGKVLFNSAIYGGKNLMFNDKTQRLFDVKEKNTFLEWLGPGYLDIIEGSRC